MGRALGLIATALGAFLIVGALLLRFYVAEQAIKFPLNEYTITTSDATNASYFNTAELQELKGVTMVETSTNEGDVASGDSSTAVWNNFTYVRDATDDLVYNFSTERLAFNRRSGELVNCCGANINGRKMNLSGLAFEFPFNAQKTTYEMFDTTLLKTHPVSYAGKGKVDGLTVYKYVESVAPTQVGTESLPGSLVGLTDQPTVSLGEFYAGTTTAWVDPISGEPVSVTTARHLYLVDSSGTQVLNLLNATFVPTPNSVAAAVKTAKSNDAKVTVLTLILPLTIGVAGLILLVIGFISGRARPAYDYSEYEDPATAAPV